MWISFGYTKDPSSIRPRAPGPMPKSTADPRERPSLGPWGIWRGRVRTVFRRTVFTRYSKLVMDTSGSLPKEASPASTVSSSPSSTRRTTPRSPATIHAASPKIGVVFFGLEHPMVFCNTPAVCSAATRRPTDCRLPLSYHLPRPVTASCSCLPAMVLQSMTDGSSFHWNLQPQHSAPGPMTAFGLRLQLGSLHTTRGICAPYLSPASQWSRSKVSVPFRMVLSGCERTRPSCSGTRAVSVLGVQDTSYLEHVYSRSSRTHVGFSGSAPIRVLLRYRPHAQPTACDLRYSQP